MRRFLLVITTAIIAVSCSRVNPDCRAARNLATRILGERAGCITFVSDTTKSDSFRLEQNGDRIQITGDNPVSMSVGLNYYLRNYLGIDYTWKKCELQIPDKFPCVTEPVERTAKVENRFFLNYCTYGYALPWFDWEDWQWFIDWMALNGINMPLAITGQEYIWMEVWKQMGMNEDEIRKFFVGPAHLPWQRMGEIDEWQGPLPQEWINGQMELQKQILSRERELGMHPVLPAFSGHVPAKIAELNPNADVKKLASWCSFPSAYFLNPTDPLFSDIQKRFLEKQTEVFGTDHFYGADPFNELDPPSRDPAYLGEVTGKIYSTMSQVDKDAVWIEMAWIYFSPHIWTPEAIKASMAAVPKGKIMMLDYQGEYTEMWRKSDSHHGQPFIWCYLGDFGGVNVLEGKIKDVDKLLTDLFNTETSCAGVGSTLEGFSVCPHPFEYTFERVWCDSLEPDMWIRQWSYLRRRPGDASVETEDAWQRLIDEVFIHEAAYYNGSSMSQRPGFQPHNPATQLPYDNSVLLECCRTLLSNPSDTEQSRYDIVALYTQVLANQFTVLADKFNEARGNRDIERMKELRDLSKQIFADADKLLLTNRDFLFGRWISDAKRFGVTAEQQDYYEVNARTIVTKWGGNLDDYARRLWQGLVGDYFCKRWQAFFDGAIAKVEKGENADTEWYNSEVAPKLNELTEYIMYSKTAYPSKPQGDTYEVAKDIDSRVDGYIDIIYNR